MAKTDLERLHALVDNDLLCNTSYPYKPEYFEQYLSDKDIMTGVDALSLYFHIPFCKKLCRFCEYVKFLLESEDDEAYYLNLVNKQVSKYFENHGIKLLYGLDIGGGTPSSLSEKSLEKLFKITDQYTSAVPKAPGYESSFEFSYNTINEDKIAIISSAGFDRVSTGIQIYNADIMNQYNRDVAKSDNMMAMNDAFKKAGVKKINVDIMYGFPYQTRSMLESTIAVIRQLNVEQVTLYEIRYNQNRLSSGEITRQSLFDQYCRLYDALINLGYKGRFSQNTFSKSDNDEGVSSYIRYRMKYGIPYKGFGISAQSMSFNGISYNSLKGVSEPHFPRIDKIDERYSYWLPKEEIVGKFVSISLYNGSFNIDIISKILGNSAQVHYQKEFEYLLEKQYITINGDTAYLTKAGFERYAVVAAFFWSKEHRTQYMNERENR